MIDGRIIATAATKHPNGAKATDHRFRQQQNTRVVIPKTVDPWDMLRKSLDEFTADYMEDRGQPPQQQREALFP